MVAAGQGGVDAKGDTTVFAWAGDGGTFDIGLQALSGAAERNEDILYICYDNEAYMNTGIQRSSATPLGTWTTTTPDEHPEAPPKKDIMGIMAAHRIPYAATATMAYPDDLLAKVQAARKRKAACGSSTCCRRARPAGRSRRTRRSSRRAWPYSRTSSLSSRSRTARRGRSRSTRSPRQSRCLRSQGQFRHLMNDEAALARVRANVERRWRSIVARTHAS